MTTDFKTIDNVMTTFYQAISFAAASKPNYVLLQELFHATARVTPPKEDTGGVVTAKSIEQFTAAFDAIIDKEELVRVGAREKELSRHTLTFGRTAVVSSSYEFTLIGSETPLARGVNTLQFVFDDERWWILSLSWDRAKDGAPLTVVHDLK